MSASAPGAAAALPAVTPPIRAQQTSMPPSCPCRGRGPPKPHGAPTLTRTALATTAQLLRASSQLLCLIRVRPDPVVRAGATSSHPCLPQPCLAEHRSQVQVSQGRPTHTHTGLRNMVAPCLGQDWGGGHSLQGPKYGRPTCGGEPAGWEAQGTAPPHGYRLPPPQAEGSPSGKDSALAP